MWENFSACLNLTFDHGHMIKNNFFEVHTPPPPPPPPVIAVQEKLLATQPYNLTYYRKRELIRFWEQSLENVSFMSDFLTPSNLKVLNLGQPPYYLLKYCI